MKQADGASPKPKAALARERRRDLIAPECLSQMRAILLWKFWRGRSHYCRNQLTAKESRRSFSDIYEIK
ncbi:hypothetical protein [Microcoleus sp. ARI1-A1]|uniref:hypothetical protein n=1 Tax=Microcoleus sp. ARI1-A1 TaxID=2818556 RepID=UPI002FD6AF28